MNIVYHEGELNTAPDGTTNGDLLILNTPTSNVLYFWNRRWLFIVDNNYQAGIGNNDLRLTALESDNLDSRITQLENTRNIAASNSDGIVHQVLLNEPFTLQVTTTTEHPAVKMFNQTGTNYTWTATIGTETRTGGLDHGRFSFFHPGALGDVSITFTPIEGGGFAPGFLILENAGG